MAVWNKTVYIGGQGEITGEKVPLYRNDLSGAFRGGGAGFYRKNKEKILGRETQLLCLYSRRDAELHAKQ